MREPLVARVTRPSSGSLPAAERGYDAFTELLTTRAHTRGSRSVEYERRTSALSARCRRVDERS